MNLSLLILLLLSASCEAATSLAKPAKPKERLTIKVGFLMVKNDPFLRAMLGYSTTASAVEIALRRINKERLLDQVDWK